MSTIDFNEIHIFIKVVQSGSFTKASHLLKMPVSTVSAKVASLEKRLGTTLMQRTTRQLRLTQAGTLFFDKSVKAIEEIQEAENSLTTIHSEPQGILKITAPTYLANLLLPEVIKKMNKLYPKLKIEITLTDDNLDLIAQGIDVAIRAGQLKDSSLIAKKIGEAYFLPFATNQYLKNNGIPKHPKDLKDHQCIQFNPIGNQEWIFTNGKNEFKFYPNGQLVVDDLTFAESLASNHQGIAILPNSICKLKSKKEFIQLLPGWKLGERSLYILYPPQKFISPKTKAFLDIAYDEIKKLL